MAKTIFKYIPTKMEFEQELPEGAEILTVQMQDNRICFWALVDTEKSKEKRKFYVYGTGQPVCDLKLKYIGTVQDLMGLVWHLFEDEGFRVIFN